MTPTLFLIYAGGLVLAGYMLGYAVRGRKIDAQLVAASKRADEVLRRRAWGDGYSTGIAVERRTGEFYRRTRDSLPAEMFDADRYRNAEGSDWNPNDEEAA